MSIDAIDTDFGTVFTLGEWLESDEAATLQRHLEEKIMQMLFSDDPSSAEFQNRVFQLAWLGSRPEQRALLEREIVWLNSDDPKAEKCDIWKSLKKGAKKVGGFVADHAVEIAVGVAIVATGVGIAVATGYAISASVGGVVVAGAGSVFSPDEKKNPKIPSVPNPSSKEELAVFGQPLPSSVPKIDLPASANELLVTPNGVWVQGQFFPTTALMNESTLSPIWSQGSTPVTDWKTFTYYSYLSQQSTSPSPQLRGEAALALGNYNQALQDLGQAIDSNPKDPVPYLERGIAHFGLGQYESSLEDYSRFVSETPETTPLSLTDFSLGFARGIRNGVYESGEGMYLFFVDCIKHPIQTSRQVIGSITALVDLVRNDEWGTLAEALSPEIYELVTQWDALPSDKRGELAGFAIGKFGADILAPGAIVKVASKSAKSAQELVAICKNLHIAKETLILETAAGIGDAVKVSEIVQNGQTMMALGEEVGLTAREMSQLKQAGKLEGAIANNSERIAINPALRESVDLFKKAEAFLKPYKGYMPESECRELIQQTGIRTFPRPEGIPGEFRIKLSNGGAGMKYVHPLNEQTYIRVMPGKPHSPYPHQQKPYITQMIDGKTLDQFGNIVAADSEAAHIPIDKFKFDRDLFYVNR